MEKEETMIKVPLWVTQVDNPIVLFDERHKITFLNDSWNSLLSVPILSFIGKSIDTLISSPLLGQKLHDLSNSPVELSLPIAPISSKQIYKLKLWKEALNGQNCYWILLSIASIDQQVGNLPLAEVSPNAFYQVDISAKRPVKFVNEHFKRLTGYELEHFFDGEHNFLSALIHSDDRTRVHASIESHINEGGSFELEYRIVNKHGVVKWIADYGQIIVEEGEKQIQGVWHDISERKIQSLKEIKDEHYFRSIVDTMTEGVVVHDSSGKITFCNQAALDILGLTYGQISGKDSFDPHWKCIKENGDDFPGEAHPAMVTLKTGKAQENVIMGVNRPKKGIAWISINSQPIYEQGTIKGVVASFANITHFKVSQRMSIRHKKRFQKLFEAINYPVLIVNEHAQVIMFNPALNRLFGYESAEISRQYIYVLLRDQEREEYTDTFLKFLNENSEQQPLSILDDEIYAQKKNGEVFPIHLTVSHLNYDDENYALCIIQDLTEDIQRQKLEKAHKKITDSLRYARRIQLALLDNHDHLLDDFKDAMILFSPKDIVSGDFYWYERIQQLDFDEKTMSSSMRRYKILVVADCTGHGVPGAFMAALGNSFLHEIINEHHIFEPHQILMALDQKVQMTLRNRGGSQMQDGMDIGIILINEATKEAYFSGAKHPLYLVRNNKIERIKGSAYSVGGKRAAIKEKKFEKQVISLQENDKLYMATDGFQDQFGGTQGRKYLRNKLQKFLQQISSLPMEKQKEQLVGELVNWKKDEPQTDDILLIGVEI